MSTNLIILFVLVAALTIYMVYNMIVQRKASKVLTEADFVAGYRKGQLIDIREATEFKGGHILGARNVPMSQFRVLMGGLRKDQPVYLYCQNQIKSQRASYMLYKAGYPEVYQLSGGYKKWSGKIKK